MGGFFGITSNQECLMDVFFGVDYHSHLGTRRAGLAAYDKKVGLQRQIHNIENSPFRTKFEHIFNEMYGTSAIGCISDFDPQPLLFRSKIGTYAISFIGAIENSEELINEYLADSGHYFDAMTSGKVNSVELASSPFSYPSVLLASNFANQNPDKSESHPPLSKFVSNAGCTIYLFPLYSTVSIPLSNAYFILPSDTFHIP